MKINSIVFLTVIFFIACKNADKDSAAYKSWGVFNGNWTANKYSSLVQIDTTNVQQLQVAWEYHSGDADTVAHSQIQCNPIMVNGVLYGTSPKLTLFAIDAATGKEKWNYKPFDKNKGEGIQFGLNSNRGVAYWSDGKDDQRIFYGAGPFIHAVNANSGQPVAGFGNNGRIDLHDGLEMEDANTLFVTLTSPPAVYKDLLITGMRVSEAMDAAPGHIRAFDVRTGKMKWIFHTIPQPGEPGYETWEDPNAWKRTGGANNWAGMTIDQEKGIAYIPIGSASADFYGGKRLGSDLYATSLLALDAATGKRKWHFQFIHHDTWDWDPSSAPVLVSVDHDGKKIDAVAQTTKTGFVYLFNRETGQSLFPIVETPVDTAVKLVGEKLWPTQPFPQKPAPFVRQTFTEKDLNPYLSKEEYEEVKARLKTLHTGKMFTPQSTEGTIIFPGLDGGAEWGGPAVDPESGILYVNANQVPWIMKMLPVNRAGQSENYQQAGMRLYRQNCMQCHGADRKGGSNYPSLIDVGKRYVPESFVAFINNGRRMMPGFKHLSQQDKDAIATFVLNIQNSQQKKYERKMTAADSFRLVPYQPSGYNKFLSKSNLPAIAPPWGVLNAIDLNTGEYVWKIAFGEDSLFKAKGVKETGTENYGGPVVTKGGLLFIAATKDRKFRAYHKKTGKLLWETTLPAPGFATPAMYEVDGRQFIVIACGGGKLGTKSGDSYVAFALPQK